MSEIELKQYFLKTRDLEAISAYLQRPNPKRLTGIGAIRSANKINQRL
ncbi:MAG: hypothetical protein ACFBSE_18710 [Prochloraceae cyanobacterium]